LGSHTLRVCLWWTSHSVGDPLGDTWVTLGRSPRHRLAGAEDPRDGRGGGCSSPGVVDRGFVPCGWWCRRTACCCVLAAACDKGGDRMGDTTCCGLWVVGCWQLLWSWLLPCWVKHVSATHCWAGCLVLTMLVLLLCVLCVACVHAAHAGRASFPGTARASHPSFCAPGMPHSLRVTHRASGGVAALYAPAAAVGGAALERVGSAVFWAEGGAGV
jgi:hypothetical protein